jgi:hypothetical protein
MTLSTWCTSTTASVHYHSQFVPTAATRGVLNDPLSPSSILFFFPSYTHSSTLKDLSQVSYLTPSQRSITYPSITDPHSPTQPSHTTLHFTTHPLLPTLQLTTHPPRQLFSLYDICTSYNYSLSTISTSCCTQNAGETWKAQAGCEKGPGLGF